jgi:hypothetical protein
MESEKEQKRCTNSERWCYDIIGRQVGTWGACPWKQQHGDPKNEEARIHAILVGKLSRNINLWWSLKLTIM